MLTSTQEPRKLTWQEFGELHPKYMQRKYNRLNKKRIRKRSRIYQRKRDLEKKLELQKNKPEEILAKKKYWIIVK